MLAHKLDYIAHLLIITELTLKKEEALDFTTFKNIVLKWTKKTRNLAKTHVKRLVLAP